jgi:hypothetical protein
MKLRGASLMARYFAFLATPTISSICASLPSPCFRRLPIGSCPGQASAAIRSLTMATRGAVERSWLVNGRPCTILSSSVEK